jgi:hypothetical protein
MVTPIGQIPNVLHVGLGAQVSYPTQATTVGSPGTSSMVCSQHSGQSLAFRQSRPFGRRQSSVAPQISQQNVPTTGSVGAGRELTNHVAICRASSAFVWIGVFIVRRGDTESNSNPHILSHPSGNLAPAAVCAVSTGESAAARVCGRTMKRGSVEGAATYSFA